MKIRTAIFGVYAGASAVGFAVLMGLVLRDVRLRYVESMRRTMGDTAAFLAVFAAEGDGPREAWAARLAALPSSPELLRVFAGDMDGRVKFDSAGGRDVGQIYAWPMVGGGKMASENYSAPNVAETGGELRVRAFVRRGGEPVGWVGVGRPLASVVEGVRQARWRLVWFSLAVAVVMAAAGWWLAERLTHSLGRLAAYARAVRDGRAASPPPSRADEVAAVARAFEEMRVALEGKAHVERYTQALAHEFKAPLTAIRGAAELLAENPPEPDRARFLANLRAESERLRAIVDRLLELAALEARRVGPASEIVEIGDVVRGAHTAARGLAETRGVRLALGDVAAARVRGEQFLLGQAVGNLLHNALEFSPAGGAVTLACRVDAQSVALVIEDDGPGVPEYALDKIFDRFYSLPRPDTGRKSSGLGLSIVREIARLHGGEIRLENRAPAAGARAVLTLPRA
ncbi:MAG: Sensor protein CreC [Verrucomicrobiota bacterium]